MKKDIEFPENAVLEMAIAPTEFEQWDVFLINNGDRAVKNVLAATSGYGFDNNGEKILTSTLRHFFDEIDANSVQVVEKIDPSVFGLHNEYWISYWIDGKLFDRRFVFVPESITSQNCIFVKAIGKEAVLHA
ncbi:MAG: hypothetical protein LCH67_15680 [Bacteroidetes bacterium]|nr:hypothetical protein [Bacteroidota bacterium]